jgi:hypothetical protein
MDIFPCCSCETGAAAAPYRVFVISGDVAKQRSESFVAGTLPSPSTMTEPGGAYYATQKYHRFQNRIGGFFSAMAGDSYE